MRTVTAIFIVAFGTANAESELFKDFAPSQDLHKCLRTETRGGPETYQQMEMRGLFPSGFEDEVRLRALVSGAFASGGGFEDVGVTLREDQGSWEVLVVRITRKVEQSNRKGFFEHIDVEIHDRSLSMQAAMRMDTVWRRILSEGRCKPITPDDELSAAMERDGIEYEFTAMAPSVEPLFGSVHSPDEDSVVGALAGLVDDVYDFALGAKEEEALIEGLSKLERMQEAP